VTAWILVTFVRWPRSFDLCRPNLIRSIIIIIIIISMILSILQTGDFKLQTWLLTDTPLLSRKTTSDVSSVSLSGTISSKSGVDLSTAVATSLPWTEFAAAFCVRCVIRRRRRRRLLKAIIWRAHLLRRAISGDITAQMRAIIEHRWRPSLCRRTCITAVWRR